MLAAAASWDALAAELETAGTAYQSLIAELTKVWSGPSASAMTAAATPYVTWMHTTSAQAAQTAGQAKAAVAAYEAAFAMTVPPPVIAANRAQLAALLATNFLGQNTPAIAATEAHYAEMWAQDATAMYGYADSAAAASRLTAFTPPPQTTNPAGPAVQSGAVGHAVSAAATKATQLAAAVGRAGTVNPLAPALHSVAAPAAATPAAEGLLATLVPAALVLPLIEFSITIAATFGDALGSFVVDLLGTFLFDVLGVAEIDEGLAPLEELTGLQSPVSANLGEATLLSGLSVPQAWTLTVTSTTQQAGTLPRDTAATGPAAIPAMETATPIVGIAAAGLAGRATATIGRSSPTRQRPPPPTPPDQPQRLPYALLVGMDIELRELAELRASEVLTDEEYAQQKQQLLGR